MKKALFGILGSTVFLCIITVIAPLTASAEDEIRLIVRGDDMGMTQSSLDAFEEAFNRGVLTVGAIQVCAPWFEGAAAICQEAIDGINELLASPLLSNKEKIE